MSTVSGGAGRRAVGSDRAILCATSDWSSKVGGEVEDELAVDDEVVI